MSEKRYWSPFYEEERAATPLWQLGDYRIVRCKDSGLVYLANPPSPEDLEEFYSLGYFEGEQSRRGYASYQEDEPILRVNFRDLLQYVLATERARGRSAQEMALLDYGCAYGYFLDEARTHFGAVRGIEINAEVARVGRERFDLEIHCGDDGAEALEPRSLDIVTMWDVIEHLQRPRSTLLQCARALREGGSLYLTTGDVGSLLARLLGRRWRLINPPQHICYFSKDTLASLLDACGFEVVSVRRCGKRVSIGLFLFILNYLLGRRHKPVSSSRFAKRSIYLNLFDVMFVHGRKKA